MEKSSIKLTYSDLNSEGFADALGELANQKGFATFPAAYNIAKIYRKFNNEMKLAREAYFDWSKDYFVKDDEGKFKAASTPSALTPWEIKEDKVEEFHKKMSDFLSTKITIHADPIKIEDLGTVKMSPKQIVSLESIIDQV